MFGRRKADGGMAQATRQVEARLNNATSALLKETRNASLDGKALALKALNDAAAEVERFTSSVRRARAGVPSAPPAVVTVAADADARQRLADVGERVRERLAELLKATDAASNFLLTSNTQTLEAIAIRLGTLAEDSRALTAAVADQAG